MKIRSKDNCHSEEEHLADQAVIWNTLAQKKKQL